MAPARVFHGPVFFCLEKISPPMNPEFWHERWEQGQIGFHLDEYHPLLTSLWPTLELPADGRVLVPLCGKTRDMHLLAQWGHTVIGAELSEVAARDFFDESGQSATIADIGRFRRYRGPAVSILVGDFFQLDAGTAGVVDAVFDRAALIALPEDMRQAYVEHLGQLMPAGSRGLLITVEYEPGMIDGPPFLVTETEVLERFGGWADVTRLGSAPSLVKGLECQEAAYLITR